MKRASLVAATATIALGAGASAAVAQPDNVERARQKATAAQAELRSANLRLAGALVRGPAVSQVVLGRAFGNLQTFFRLAASTNSAIDAAVLGSNLADPQRAALLAAESIDRVAARRVRAILVRLSAPGYGVRSAPSVRSVRRSFFSLRVARQEWYQARSQLAVAARPVVLGGFGMSVPAVPFPFLPAALPKAGASGRVSDEGGVQRLDLVVRGLPPLQRYTVFLTQNASAPFGVASYLADFTTRADGMARVRASARIKDAFANVGGVNVPLTHLAVWFADPQGDNGLFTGANRLDPDGDGDPGLTTPFDRDGSAGVAVLTSGATPLP